MLGALGAWAAFRTGLLVLQLERFSRVLEIGLFPKVQ